MTNSTPKLTNRVERQGSPCTGGKRSSFTIRTTTYFHSGGRPKGSPGRMSCSPSIFPKISRSSPVKSDTPRDISESPTNSFYAGAKFSEPPSPATLPQPPIHWMSIIDSYQQFGCSYININNHLERLVNVPA